MQSITWIGDTDGYLQLLDQTLLPTEIRMIQCRDVACAWEAISMLRVRGAPAIGIAAAYGVCLSLVDRLKEGSLSASVKVARAAADYLATSRPTAVNLFWALNRMRAVLDRSDIQSTHELASSLLREAKQIHDEDRRMCHSIGKLGAELLSDGIGVLTHCNAGGLATSEYGTALSAIFTAQDQGKRLTVFTDETRPLLQGARLTAWELAQRNIDCTLICDSMAGQVMREGRIQAVIVGADRITANGDTANKIGTYSVAILANFHKIPFYVAAPTSTFDLSIDSGKDIPIEQRNSLEITDGFGKRTAPVGINVYNPAFDVTPAHLITAIITEVGVISPVNREQIAAVVHPSLEEGWQG